MIERETTGRRVLFRWIWVTWAGWLLGLPITILLAVAGEALGVGGQTLVGAGMGAGVGFLQARALRTVLKKSARWFWSCVVGLAVPFLAADVARPAVWSSPWALFAVVAAGGLIVGAWQSLILRPRFRNIKWWVVASTVGWALSAGTAAVATWFSRWRTVRGVWGALTFLGVVALGGLILGAVTGAALVWMLRRERETSKQRTAAAEA
jgi:hypothetical protein